MKRVEFSYVTVVPTLLGVDTERVAQEALEMPGVVYATNYKYMCSDPGRIRLRKAIQEQNLNGWW